MHQRPTQTNKLTVRSSISCVKNDDNMLLSWALVSGVQFSRILDKGFLTVECHTSKFV
jgi:hypothetical protein